MWSLPVTPLSPLSPTDVVEACETTGHSSEDVLRGACLQDQRAAWHPVHHRTLHQLRHRHGAQLRRACRALDQTRGSTALPAQLLTSKVVLFYVQTHILVFYISHT